ncbi:MAG TPA: hypothetical protein VMT57_08960 [Candidatus Thermoplasmatota archaeon]|nr:hypothetical protein [Candidatus Thermoplasmatota archaeon]
MELNLSENIRTLLLALLTLVLPLAFIVLGLALTYYNVWLYLLCITWFGTGVVFYGTLQ